VFPLPSLESRRWTCVSPTETKILRCKVERAFRVSFPVIPGEVEESLEPLRGLSSQVVIP
jgi:hypothetical protein